MTNISGGLVHELPADLADALNAKKGSTELWEALTPIARNEFNCWKKRPCCIHRTDKKPGKWQQEVLIEKKRK